MRYKYDNIKLGIDYEFIYNFSEELLDLDSSLRWIGISNKYGVLINVEQREGLKPLMTEEESEEYAAAAVSRYRTRVKFQSKIGKLNYAVGRYENVTRITVPISNDYFLLLTIDKEKNYDDLINKILVPFISKNRNKFHFEDMSD